ncbi:MAG: AAA family ATPase [Pseudomonadota bacterium]
MSAAAQIPLQVTREQGAPLRFLRAPSNAEAAAQIADPAAWVGGRLALIGPPGSGKSLLAREFAAAAGAELVAAPALVGADLAALSARGAAVQGAEDALLPQVAEALFHLHERAAAAGRPLLLTGRTPPARWPSPLKDLATRLAAMPVARIGPPEPELLEALAARLLDRRGLVVEPGLPRYLSERIERSHAALLAAVERLDAASLAEGRRVTRALARAVLGLG